MKRSIILFAAMISCSLICNAQCISGNCESGQGTYVTKSGSKYIGKFYNKKFHGKGKYIFANRDVYEGLFYQGVKHGVGTYIFAEGHQYVGEFKNDQRCGGGKIIFADGSKYQGAWLNDKPNGKGKLFYSDGSVFEGLFANGKPTENGKLQLYSKNENTSENAVSNSVTQASITLENYEQKPLSDCTNQYCDGKNGKFLYRDGSIYYGYFKNGNPDGSGVTVYHNGDIYEGQWAEHGPNGDGTMIKSDGKVYSGQWEMGALKNRNHSNEAMTMVKKSKLDQKVKTTSNDAVEVFAVVVGVATYSHMQSLKYTDDDAYQLYAFLKSPEGGAIADDHIALLIDDAATNKNITTEIGRIFSKADANDVVMLYMSGHGLEGNFVPVDYDGMNNLLAYTTILSLLNECPAKQKVMITDACHSGSNYAMKGSKQFGLQTLFDQYASSYGGTALISSCKANEVSLEFSGFRQGVFSHYLIRGLKGEANSNEDRIISIKELYDYIYINVRHYTNESQTPSISGSYDSAMPVSMIRMEGL